MKMSVSQRIILTLGSLLLLFLLTSLVSFQSFNQLSKVADGVVNDSSPRRVLSADLDANLANTKFLLLTYLHADNEDKKQEIGLALASIKQRFEDDFAALDQLSQAHEVREIAAITQRIFEKAQGMLQAGKKQDMAMQRVQTQAEEFAYLTDELPYTLEDLLFDEYRLHYTQVLKPLRDDIAYLINKVAALFAESEPNVVLVAEIEKYQTRIENKLIDLKALDTEAYESVVEMWQPYLTQLRAPSLSLLSLIEAQNALAHANQLLAEIELLVEQNSNRIQTFSLQAEDYATALSQTTHDQVDQGKRLILAGALVASLISAILGYGLVRYIQTSLKRVVGGMAQMRNGDLTGCVMEKGQDELAQLAQSSNALTKEWRGLVKQILSSTTALHQSANTSRDISHDSLNGVAQQGLQSARIAATASQMETTSQDVANHAQISLQEAQKAQSILQENHQNLLHNSEQIQSLAKQVDTAMMEVASLKENTDAISNIVHVIKEIAEQTNLLALNAAIEAARAGESGRGFSVVADEVRSLANRTQGSISDIEHRIEKLQTGAQKTASSMTFCTQQSKASSQALMENTQALMQVLNSVNQMREMNAQVASATVEQKETVAEMSLSLNEINQIMIKSKAGAEEASDQSDGLLVLSDELLALVTRFKVA